MPGGNKSKSQGTRVGQALAAAYPPDRAADEALDRLIEKLGAVDWPKSGNEGNRSCRS